MDSFQISTLIFQASLILFTAGLVFATILLWRCTKRYANATDKLLRAQQLRFIDALYYRVTDTGNDRHARALVGVEEGRDVHQFIDAEKEKWDDLCEKSWRAYRWMTESLLNDIVDEIPQDFDR